MLRTLYSEKLSVYKLVLKEQKITFDEKLHYISNLSETDGTNAAE
jgi:hypothetical protein